MPTPSASEFRLLALLVAEGELTGRQLAKSYQAAAGSPMSYGTLYTAVRRLKESGWVSVRDGSDRVGAVKFISATGSGRQVLSKARETYFTLWRFAVAGEAGT